MPFSTAECERGFSVMNRLKSKDRNRSKNVLETLMILNTKKEKTSNFEKLGKRLFTYNKN